MVVGRGRAAGIDGDILLLCIGAELLVHARGDDKFRTGGDGFVDLRGGGNSACADDHIRTGLLHCLDGERCARCAEGHFCDRHAAFTQRLCERRRIALRVVQLDNRHNADFGNLLIEFVHDGNPPVIYVVSEAGQRRPEVIRQAAPPWRLDVFVRRLRIF